MTKNNRNEVRLLPGICKRYGISVQVESELQKLVEDLRVYKKTWLMQPVDKRKTSKLRADELIKIKELASALKQAIMGLAYEDRWELNEEYHRPPGAPGRVVCSDMVLHVRLNNPSTVEPRYFALSEKVIPDIEAALINVLQRRVLSKHDEKLERLKLEPLVDFIQHIAIILKPSNIVPGGNNKFNEVYCAVFEDAGVIPSTRLLTRYCAKFAS